MMLRDRSYAYDLADPADSQTKPTNRFFYLLNTRLVAVALPIQVALCFHLVPLAVCTYVPGR